MTRPLLVDMFCCEGGAAMGYHRAGFDVIGVDIVPQPRYPFPMIVADALQPPINWAQVAAVHASPPCQHDSQATGATGDRSKHPDLIGPTRELLEAVGLPYVLENVERTATIGKVRPDVTLCGSMFGLRVRRHRVFELNWFAWSVPCGPHRGTVDVTGNAGGPNQTPRAGFPLKYRDADHAREVMGMPWASRHGCVEAIPPAYTEWIGDQLLAAL